MPHLHRLALQHPLPKPHYPLLCTITLASLVKGRWIDGKAQTVDLLRLLAVYPPFYTTSFSAVKTEGLSRNPRLYQPFQNRTILRKALYPCPPSKKGEVLLLGQAEPTMVGIEFDRTSIPKTSKHSLCHNSPSPTLPKPHYPTLSATFLAPLPKGAGLRQGYFLL